MRAPALVLSVAAACSLVGCGGALPLGHPAHALPAGKTTIAGGVAGTVLTDSSASTNDAAASTLQDLAIGPDLSPWVAARGGLGDGFEAGISASTRAIRIDGRRAFATERWALSIGLGASFLFPARAGGADSLTGVLGGGFDVPVLVGWRSRADLYALWIGPRVGADLFSGQLDAGPDADATPASGRHLRVGGLAGLRAGLRHVYGVVEVEAAYHQAGGTLGTRSLTLTGFTVAPAGALVVSF